MPKAPKDIRKNLKYRREILQLGQSSQSAREEIWLAAARDPIWFMDVFCWTLNPKDYPDCPERPFVTYPFQERAARRINAAIGKHGLVIPKTRAVGGTYIILATLFHRWMFRRMQTFLLASAKEDRVDEYDDPDCLFWKLDYFLKCLPNWMRPASDRVKLRLVNLEQESVFNGESTNQNLARGGRRTAILADEAAAMRHDEQVMASLSQVSNSTFYLSTPQGAFGGFYGLYKNFMDKAPDRVLVMHWTDHPVYAEGLEFIDEPYLGWRDPSWPSGKPTSPWYRNACLEFTGPKRIAQELDISFNEAGGQFFEAQLIARLMKETARPPLATGEIDSTDDQPRWVPSPAGRMKLWTPILANGLPAPGIYAVGCDIAQGSGGEMSSQSAISVVNALTGEKVAEFAHNRIAPHNFARYAVAVCRWFYNAKLIWGAQGPGVPFGKVVTEECRYYQIYYRKDETSVGGKQSRKMGHAEQGESRQIMFNDYRDALHTGRFINRSETALKECSQFVTAPDGTVQHSKAIQRDQDPENSGKLHGDIVIADALTNVLLSNMAIRVEAKPSLLSKPPYGSFAWRTQLMERNADPYDWRSVDVN